MNPLAIEVIGASARELILAEIFDMILFTCAINGVIIFAYWFDRLTNNIICSF